MVTTAFVSFSRTEPSIFFRILKTAFLFNKSIIISNCQGNRAGQSFNVELQRYKPDSIPFQIWGFTLQTCSLLLSCECIFGGQRRQRFHLVQLFSHWTCTAADQQVCCNIEWLQCTSELRGRCLWLLSVCPHTLCEQHCRYCIMLSHNVLDGKGTFSLFPLDLQENTGIDQVETCLVLPQ